MQNINIGYDPCPQSLIRSVRVFANIENAYTFTEFDGYDPEVGGSMVSIGAVIPACGNIPPVWI